MYKRIKAMPIDGEYWKDIVETKGRFQISNKKRIRDKKTNILRSCNENSNGYIYVHLTIDGKDYYKRRCRLMAKTFVPNPENKPQVNHINGVRSDDSISNLEWVTASENVKDSYKRRKRKKLEEYYAGWLPIPFEYEDQ